MYQIPRSCGLCYIGQTADTVMDQCEEHERCIRLLYPGKSALVEHSLQLGHKSLFSFAMVLLNASSLWECLIMEAVEIKLDSKVLNQEEECS